MSDTRLSIIVTVHNKGPFVKRCLDSIAEQMDDSVQSLLMTVRPTVVAKYATNIRASSRFITLVRMVEFLGLGIEALLLLMASISLL